MSDVHLTPGEQRVLLAIARTAIARFLGDDAQGPAIPQRLQLERRGAFITLREGGELRGCIGYIEPVEPLDRAIRQLAVKAASEDPRFDPVERHELDALTIECSVLTPLRPCGGPEDVTVGRDGLVVERAPRRGLLLPEVAVEAGWNSEEFLAETCVKAGLARHAWKEKGTRLFAFETQHFAESVEGSSDGT